VGGSDGAGVLHVALFELVLVFGGLLLEPLSQSCDLVGGDLGVGDCGVPFALCVGLCRAGSVEVSAHFFQDSFGLLVYAVAIFFYFGDLLLCVGSSLCGKGFGVGGQVECSARRPVQATVRSIAARARGSLLAMTWAAAALARRSLWP
jgi:hypothetical protein